MKKSTMIFASLFLFGWGFAQADTPASAMPAGSFETRLVEAAHQQAGIDVRNGADISGDFTDPTFNAFIRAAIGIPTGAFFVIGVLSLSIFAAGATAGPSGAADPLTGASGFSALGASFVLYLPSI